MADEWGPLAGLAGEWEGDTGLDTAYAHEHEQVLGTPYRERTSLKPFGPVDNGTQHLWGLDYRRALWKEGQDDPFHTETGYWLWCSASNEIMIGFVVPRGITVLAGGVAAPGATTMTLKAAQGEPQYTIGEGLYLARNASVLSFEVTIAIGEDTWSYEETTMLRMNEFEEPFAHTDHNTLRRTTGEG